MDEEVVCIDARIVTELYHGYDNMNNDKSGSKDNQKGDNVVRNTIDDEAIDSENGSDYY